MCVVRASGAVLVVYNEDMPVTGVLAPVPTPFDEPDRVDLVRLRAAFARWVASPLSGFVVLGSNGEAALLDEDESDLVIGAARDIVPSGRAFIVGTGCESTQATIRADAPQRSGPTPCWCARRVFSSRR